MQYSNSYLNDLQQNVKAFAAMLRRLKNKRILVTGATGLIGSACVDFLLYGNRSLGLGAQVIASGRSEERLEERFRDWEDEIELFPYDVTTPLEYPEEIDFILHCAGTAHPVAYATQPVETLLTNVLGVRHLLDWAKNKNCRLLYVSSSEVYGNKEDARLYTEDGYYEVDILNARACYPSGKRAAETLCKAYMEEYGADVVIARPGHVYGPTMTKEDTRASAQFFWDVLEGQNIVMKSDGQQLRSYCYGMDCVTAILTILLEGKSGEAYNISNRASVVTIREMAETVAKVSGRKVLFAQATEQEKKGYTMMKVSALDATKLEDLGWQGRYGIQCGAEATYRILSEEKTEKRIG